MLVPVDADLPVDEVDALVVSAAVGLHASEVIGQRIPVDGSTSGGVFRSGKPLITETLKFPDSGIHRCRAAPRDRDAAAAHDEIAGVIASPAVWTSHHSTTVTSTW